MSSGSVVFWEGGMWHAGGANTTESIERMGFFINTKLAICGPREIQLLSIPQDTVRTMPKKLQRLIGYHSFGLGVDGRDPLDVLEDGIVVNPEAKLANEWRETY